MPWSPAIGYDSIYPWIFWSDYHGSERPRHLIPVEAEMWYRFRDLFPLRYDLVAYDVNVGEGDIPAGMWTPEMRRMIWILTSGRIDILGYKDGRLELLEIKRFAHFSAVGQCLCYNKLLHDTCGEMPYAWPFVVTERLKVDMGSCCESMGIGTIIV
jgi:hypothetical protein